MAVVASGAQPLRRRIVQQLISLIPLPSGQKVNYQIIPYVGVHNLLPGPCAGQSIVIWRIENAGLNGAGGHAGMGLPDRAA